MTRTVKKRKVKKKAILFLLLILFAVFFAVYYVFNFHITNIYISGNTVYTDQEIIDMANLNNYPRTFNHNELVIKNALENDKYIQKVNVKKRGFFREVYIDIEENTPLMVYNGQTILKDGKKSDDSFDVPTLINNIDNEKIYNKLLEGLWLIDTSILKRISEIKYEPNEVDKQRFKFMMSDGNHVYITLRKIERINNYIHIISAFDGKKGTLYLDSGEYFEIFGGSNE